VYTLIKVSGERKLKYKHIHLWETHHKQKLQKGFNIVFKDGNSQNFDIDNLENISDQELMSRNTLSRYPTEIKQQLFAIRKLNKTIKTLEKCQ
jgi:HNH endonuclease